MSCQNDENWDGPNIVLPQECVLWSHLLELRRKYNEVWDQCNKYGIVLTLPTGRHKYGEPGHQEELEELATINGFFSIKMTGGASPEFDETRFIITGGTINSRIPAPNQNYEYAANDYGPWIVYLKSECYGCGGWELNRSGDHYPRYRCCDGNNCGDMDPLEWKSQDYVGRTTEGGICNFGREWGNDYMDMVNHCIALSPRFQCVCNDNPPCDNDRNECCNTDVMWHFSNFYDVLGPSGVTYGDPMCIVDDLIMCSTNYDKRGIKWIGSHEPSSGYKGYVTQVIRTKHLQDIWDAIKPAVEGWKHRDGSKWPFCKGEGSEWDVADAAIPGVVNLKEFRKRFSVCDQCPTPPTGPICACHMNDLSYVLNKLITDSEVLCTCDDLGSSDDWKGVDTWKAVADGTPPLKDCRCFPPADCKYCNLPEETDSCAKEDPDDPTVWVNQKRYFRQGDFCNAKGLSKYATNRKCGTCVECEFEEDDWLPKTDTECEGVEFEQTNSKGIAKKCSDCEPYSDEQDDYPCPTEKRDAIGTKTDDCAATCGCFDYYDDSVYCSQDEQAFSYTVGKGSICSSPDDKREAKEDLDCYQCVTCIYDENGWGPPTDTECEGVEFEQTHKTGYAPQCQDCTPGSNDDGSEPCPEKTRDAIGTKKNCDQCTNPDSPNYNSGATDDDGSCKTCANTDSCDDITDEEDDPVLPGSWWFDTTVCTQLCLASYYSGGISGWGNAISCSSGTGQDFMVKNNSCTKGLQISIKSNPNIDITLKKFSDGKQTVAAGSSGPGGTLTFTIPPGFLSTDITDNFTAWYSCTCNPKTCRAGVMTSAPTYQYVTWNSGGTGSSIPCPTTSKVGSCCSGCCAHTETGCHETQSSSFTADNGKYYASCYG